MKRSTDQILAGVCAGLAEKFDMDPTIMRIIYVLGTLITGLVPGLLVYVILYFVMDEP